MAGKLIARTRAEFVNEAAGKEYARHAKKSRHALNYISETFFE